MGITYTPRGHAAYECALESASGLALKIAGTIVSGTADESGDAMLTSNRSLVMMLAAFANNEALSRRLRAQEKRQSHRNAAEGYRKNVLSLADMIERLDGDDAKSRDEWCSGCFAFCTHRPVRGMTRPVRTYIRTLARQSGRSGARAIRRRRSAPHTGRTVTPKYCAEHRHDIASFDRVDARLARLDDYADWLAFDKANLSRVTKVSTVALLSAAVITPMAFAAAQQLVVPPDL